MGPDLRGPVVLVVFVLIFGIPFFILLWICVSAFWTGVQRHGWWNLLDELLCGSIAGLSVVAGILTQTLLQSLGQGNFVLGLSQKLQIKRFIVQQWFEITVCLMFTVGVLVGMSFPPAWTKEGSNEVTVMSVVILLGYLVGLSFSNVGTVGPSAGKSAGV